MIVRRFFEFDLDFQRTQVPSLSLAVPEQTLTVKELLDRFTRGMPMEEQFREGFYSDDDNLDDPLFDQFDFTDLDISDLQRLQEITKLRVRELQALQHQQYLQEQEEKKKARLQQFKEHYQQLIEDEKKNDIGTEKKVV